MCKTSHWKPYTIRRRNKITPLRKTSAENRQNRKKKKKPWTWKRKTKCCWYNTSWVGGTMFEKKQESWNQDCLEWTIQWKKKEHKKKRTDSQAEKNKIKNIVKNNLFWVFFSATVSTIQQKEEDRRMKKYQSNRREQAIRFTSNPSPTANVSWHAPWATSAACKSCGTSSTRTASRPYEHACEQSDRLSTTNQNNQ
jgi:hypothetical protein